MSEPTLDQLPKTRAVVEKLNFADGTANRLKSLGVFEGQTIEVSRCGNPMIVKAAGSRIAIAACLAKLISVREFEE